MANANGTSSAHSPDPWTVSVLGNHCWIVDKDHDYVAEIIYEDEERRCKPEYAEANAYLIATSLELLHACKEALSYLTEGGEDREAVKRSLENAIADTEI